MSSKTSLSLPAAILININIMLGAGIFMNTALLAQFAGALGFLSYLIVGTLLLPLVLCIAQLLVLYPEGGFYTFAQRELNTFVGFLSTWSYFVAKLASATIMIHTSTLILQQYIPAIAAINTFVFDFFVITTFILLNLLNMQSGKRIQVAFMILKIIPILFAIFTGLYFFSGTNFSAPHRIWSGIPASLGITIYATMGFEAAASISNKIENPQKNAPLAVLISYIISLIIIALYQFCYYAVLGHQLSNFPSYRNAFPALITKFSTNPETIALLGGIFNMAIAASALGGSYGILFSNNWNLHTLAKNGHLIASSWFIKTNKHAIPVLCVITEGLICALYLFLSRGNQITLQQIGSFGVVLAYTFSVLSLLAAHARKHALRLPTWIVVVGFINCMTLLSFCIYGMYHSRSYALHTLAFLNLIGVFFFFFSAQTTNQN